MNKKQALALLSLIGDLYSIINTPEPEAEPVAAGTNGNGQGAARPTQPMTVD